jgi:hypothetical protein
MGKQYENSVPRKVVADMYDVGNLFVMPAQSETFSLVTIEAALTKNFLVLNDDLKVFEELMGAESAKYVGFGSEWGGLRTDRNYQPHIERFMMDRAREIYDEIKACKPLQAHRRALQRFNSDYIFRNQLEPLIEGS